MAQPSQAGQKKKITQAFILTAGLGTRLRPLTDTMPKVMVLIAPGKPLLEHHVEWFRDRGITDFIFNLHYLPDAITSYFGDGSKWGVRIRYSDERDQALETAGALKKAEPMLDDDFLFIYGDHLHFFEPAPLFDAYFRNGGLGTIVLKTSDLPQNGDLVEFDPETKKILKLHGRPHDITAFTGNIMLNTGFDVFSKKILDHIPAGRPVKLDGEIIPKLLAENEALYAFPTDESILDIGTPEKYEFAKAYYRSAPGANQPPLFS